MGIFSFLLEIYWSYSLDIFDYCYSFRTVPTEPRYEILLKAAEFVSGVWVLDRLWEPRFSGHLGIDIFNFKC